jgi:hypothetical protein
MGQASSSPQRELTGEDLLFHVLDNDAVVRHLISTDSYHHFHSDVSKLREGSRTATDGSATQDYFHLSDSDRVLYPPPPPPDPTLWPKPCLLVLRGGWGGPC